MKLIDYGTSLAATVTYPLWGKVLGVGRFAAQANRTLLSLGASPHRVAKLKTGAKMRIDLRSNGQWPMFYSGNADRFWIDAARSLLGDDELFLDIGANIGIYSIQVAALRRIAGQCHAFEPMPANVAQLRENVALNGLSDCVTVHPFGLSDAPDTLQLAFVHQNGADTGNAEIVGEQKPGDDRPRFSIEVRRLDDITLPQRRIGVIKIDVEGHEDFAYRGGAQRLAKDRPIIIAEYNRMELSSRGMGPHVDFSELPDGYVPFHSVGRQFQPLTDWNQLHRVQNFLICPEEAISRIEGRQF